MPGAYRRLKDEKKHIVVFDIETDRIRKKSPLRSLSVKLACAYSNRTNRYYHFSGRRIPELVKLLRSAEVVVGFNCIEFDLEVLRRFGVDMKIRRKTVDIFREIVRETGNWYSLEDLAMRQNPTRYKSIFWNLKERCYGDVRLTRWVYELYLNNRLIYDKEKWPHRRNPKKDLGLWIKLLRTQLQVQQQIYGKRFKSSRDFKEHQAQLASTPIYEWDEQSLKAELLCRAIAETMKAKMRPRRAEEPDPLDQLDWLINREPWEPNPLEMVGFK